MTRPRLGWLRLALMIGCAVFRVYGMGAHAADYRWGETRVWLERS